MSSDQFRQELEKTIVGSGLAAAVEHYPVAITATSIALGWLRQRDAAPWSIVVADCEIATSSRLGGDLGFMPETSVSVILHPDIAPDHQDILWAHALLATCAGLAAGEVSVRPWWPEVAIDERDAPVGAAHVTSQLTAGKVDSSVITIRFGPHKGCRIAPIVASLENLSETLTETPAAVAETYRRQCPLKDRQVTVRRLPTGSTSGLAGSIDERGHFALRSSSTSRSSFGVDQILSIEKRRV